MWEQLAELAIEGSARVQEDFNRVRSSPTIHQPDFDPLHTQLLGSADHLSNISDSASTITSFLAANKLRVQLLDSNAFRSVNLL